MELTRAKRRVVERLKRVDSATVAELAADLELTEMAVRLHLGALESEGLVAKRTGPQIDRGRAGRASGRSKDLSRGRGRPAVSWQLTRDADRLFDDRHAELTVDLITTVRETLGDAALQQVIDARSKAQVAAYREVVGSGLLSDRVRALAALRTREGYQAEARAEDGNAQDDSAHDYNAQDGDAWLLIEHHCPICEAASSCRGLCVSELEVFQAVLGNDVTVERTEHLLQEGRRCVYRVKPV